MMQTGSDGENWQWKIEGNRLSAATDFVGFTDFNIAQLL
jgi:hypothetical protein